MLACSDSADSCKGSTNGSCNAPTIEVMRMTSLVTFTSGPAILGGKRRDGEEMVESCCAVCCVNRLTKGSSLSYYRFPTDNDRRRRWISAINRKDWHPTQYSYVCSAHFVSDKKSDDPVSPDYVPSIFKHVSSPMKRKRVCDYQKYKRKKSRVEVALREEARKEAEKRRREEVIVATVEDVAEEATGTGEDSNNDSEGLLTSETAVQTELSMENIRYIYTWREAPVRLKLCVRM